ALLHDRLAQRTARAGEARDAGGVDPDELADVGGRRDPEVRVGALRLREREVGDVVEVAVAGVVVEAAGLAREVDAQDGPRVALEDRALHLEQERSRLGARADADLLAGPDLEAVAGEEVGERARVDLHHGASMSGKCSARCSRSVSRTKRRSSGLATR